MFRAVKTRFRRKSHGLLPFLPILLLAAVLAVDFRIRPVIKEMASNQARVYATRAINDAINGELKSVNIAYDSLIRITSDNSGRITSVQTDMFRLNLLKSAMTNSAAQQLSLLQSQTIRIPIGTLSGLNILSGRGPRVEFKIVPAGFVSADIIHRFDSAGINQTRHQIILRINATISAILPGYTTASRVSSDMILAETVIVGASPESFTQVLSGQDMEGIVADYRGGIS